MIGRTPTRRSGQSTVPDDRKSAKLQRRCYSTMRPSVIAFVILTTLTGCTSRESRVWVKNYRPFSETSYAPTEGPAIRFERVDYEMLSENRDMDGYDLVGLSERRSPILEVRPDALNSKLRRHAATVGAHLVRWAESPVGLTVPSGTITVSVGDGPHPDPKPETIADYLAIYYRQTE